MRSTALACIALLGACGPSPVPATDAGADAAQADAAAHADAASSDGGRDADVDSGPVECAAPCEGDLVCGHEGYCEQRAEGEFDPSCATNLTIRCYPCAHTYISHDFVDATVCNRGGAEAAADRVVRFESAGEVICETRTTEPIAPGSCVHVSCMLPDTLGNVAGADSVRATVNPDGLALECGDPLDNSMEAGIAIGCE